MNAAELIALAECVEKAEGPSHDLFEQAFYLSFPGHYMPGRSGYGPNRWETFKRFLDAGAYLDAAMTLVPELPGYRLFRYKIGKDGETGSPYSEWIWGNDETRHVIQAMGIAATPALALTAAALRARAAQEAK